MCPSSRGHTNLLDVVFGLDLGLTGSQVFSAFAVAVSNRFEKPDKNEPYCSAPHASARLLRILRCRKPRCSSVYNGLDSCRSRTCLLVLRAASTIAGGVDKDFGPLKMRRFCAVR